MLSSLSLLLRLNSGKLKPPEKSDPLKLKKSEKYLDSPRLS